MLVCLFYEFSWSAGRPLQKSAAAFPARESGMTPHRQVHPSTGYDALPNMPQWTCGRNARGPTLKLPSKLWFITSWAP